jgi:hypothetical protein
MDLRGCDSEGKVGSLLEVSHNVIGDEYRLLILLALMERWFLFLYYVSFL